MFRTTDPPGQREPDRVVELRRNDRTSAETVWQIFDFTAIIDLRIIRTSVSTRQLINGTPDGTSVR